MEEAAQEALHASHSVALSIVQAISAALLWIVTLVSYHIPRFTLQVLSWTGVITLEFNLVKVLILGGLLTSIFSLWIKVAYLNRYTKLKEPPLPRDPGFELHPQLAANEQAQSLGSYLDEFLSAIRVFGFLEKPVFHELARHLQTRRLIAGDTLSLDSDNSFYIVIDGSCQVYVPGPDTDAEFSDDDQSPMGKFQLLNEVTNGGTLSSLFTILSLFTEKVRLRYEEDGGTESKEASPETPLTRPPLSRDISYLSLEGRSRTGSLSRARNHQQSRTSNFNSPFTEASCSPDISRGPSSPMLQEQQKQERSFNQQQQKHKNVHEPIIARAKVDTTLAVIPAEAFQRVTQKFPNASAHIIQVILARLARVTLLTGHKYLGLTKEILTTEKAINEMACYPLPSEFYASGGMQRLRRRFVHESLSPNDTDPKVHDYFNAGPPSPRFGPFMGEQITKKPFNSEAVKLKWQPQTPHQRTRRMSKDSTASSDATIELTESPTRQRKTSGASLKSRSANVREPSLPSATESRGFSFHEKDHFDLRATVMQCIAKSMGLAQPSSMPSGSPSPSAPGSPSLGAQDTRFYSSSFGSLSALAQNMDENASVSTMSSSKMHPNPELENEVEILFFPQGSTLVKNGQSNHGVYYVIDGFLDVLLPPDNKTSKSTPLFAVKPGGIAGYLASLTSSHSYVDIVAKTDVYVGYLSSQALERMMDRKPIVLLTLAKRLISLLSPLMLHIDLALEWMQVSSGQVIYNEGEQADNIYICIQGRLRGIIEKPDGSVDVKSEFGQGDSIGELECLTSSPRPWTLHAIRDTELVRMPAQLFNAIAVRHPSITVHMTQVLASRIRTEMQARSSPERFGGGNANLKTVAILPTTQHVPVTIFADKLRSALATMGASTTYLNHATVLGAMGRHAFTRMGKLKLAAWLADVEQSSRIVLYVADSQVSSPWTQTCIRQADCILLVTFGAGDPGLGEYERLMVSMKTTARKELILLHSERSVAAGSTRPFLQARPWIHTHHHIEMSGAPPNPVTSSRNTSAVVAFRKVQRGIQDRIGKYYNLGGVGSVQSTRGFEFDDYSRLSRWLCNKSVGLVLGGGGARGISHIGVLQALQEQGIPVDMVGGTSIGSFIGGLYAREADIWTTQGRAKKFSGRMSTLWRLITDLTYPITAYTTGHEFNRGIYKSFYHLHIEDFWLPYFAVTTNITWSRMETHTSGFAWRYIRASMSLAGLLPPMCDDGHMLLDGGYFDNLPVTSMLARGAEKVFASDVGSIDDNSPRTFPDTVSGWWVLFARWWPWSHAKSVPSLTEIQSRLTYVSSVKTLEEAKKTPGVFYMRQPVTEFGTMDFGKFDEINRAGYKYAKTYLAEQASQGTLPTGLIDDSYLPSATTPAITPRHRKTSSVTLRNGEISVPRPGILTNTRSRQGVRMRRASI